MANTKLTQRVISLEEVGPVSLYIQGDLDRCRNQAVFLTVHHVGSDYTSLVSWASSSSMKEVRDRAVFLHVSLPGQESESEDLPRDFTFPSMAKLGLSLVRCRVLPVLQLRPVWCSGQRSARPRPG